MSPRRAITIILCQRHKRPAASTSAATLGYAKSSRTVTTVSSLCDRRRTASWNSRRLKLFTMMQVFCNERLYNVYLGFCVLFCFACDHNKNIYLGWHVLCFVCVYLLLLCVCMWRMLLLCERRESTRVSERVNCQATDRTWNVVFFLCRLACLNRSQCWRLVIDIWLIDFVQLVLFRDEASLLLLLGNGSSQAELFVCLFGCCSSSGCWLRARPPATLFSSLFVVFWLLIATCL